METSTIVLLAVLGIVIFAVGSVVIGIGIGLIKLPIKTFTNQIDSASDVIDKTYDADNAIYNYEWFKTQYEKIDANRKQIENTKVSIEEFKQIYGDASEWGFETKQEYSRLSTIKLGLQNQDETLVAEYNARSNMANREIFMDKLPLSVDNILW